MVFTNLINAMHHSASAEKLELATTQQPTKALAGGKRQLKCVKCIVKHRIAKIQKHTTAGIRWWSPTQLLISRSQA
jgi:hypothetical protein